MLSAKPKARCIDIGLSLYRTGEVSFVFCVHVANLGNDVFFGLQ